MLKTFFHAGLPLLDSPETWLQSYEPNPGKHMQPRLVHCPLPLQRFGHLRKVSMSRSSSLLPSSCTTLLSHSFSRRGTVATSQALSSFSCWSTTHISSAFSITSSNRPTQPSATVELRKASPHSRWASASVRPDSVGHVGAGNSGCVDRTWSSGKK